MKKVLILVAMLLLVATGAWAQIIGSAHDFSGVASFGGGEICKPCHTPHNAKATGDPDFIDGPDADTFSDVPLWNHEASTETFTMYDSGTNTVSAAAPSGVSLACLSCHDGATHMDNYGPSAGYPGLVVMGAVNARLGTDLSNDHPISIDFTAATSDLTGGPTSALLFNGYVECGSCHDVHDTAGNASMLIIPNTDSDLCLDCHAK